MVQYWEMFFTYPSSPLMRCMNGVKNAARKIPTSWKMKEEKSVRLKSNARENDTRLINISYFEIIRRNKHNDMGNNSFSKLNGKLVEKYGR